MRPRRRMRGRPPVESAPSKRFLKFILPSAIHGTQTRIPEEFVRNFGDELSDFATITVPDGILWEIGLKKCGEYDVWFSSNWDQFAHYYSIRYGYVLTFKYKGNSEFGVRIHDNTATEICYPPRPKNQRSTTSLGRGRGRGRGRRGGRKCNSERTNEAAAKLKQKNPYFEATVRECALYIPAGFAAKYLKLEEPIKLQNWDGKTWDASCFHPTRTTAAMRIGKGWFRFVKENHLLRGHVCVFQLIKRRPFKVLKVDISPA